MCGIAGYNCSRHLLQGRGADWASSIAAEGLLWNERRGYDASGWMATYHPDDRLDKNAETTLYYHKSDDTATLFVKDGLLPKGTPTAMAVHTRDYTKGSPTDNRNNHPVMHHGILVTHNGSIDNHTSIIFDAKLTTMEKDKLGDVDSAAIPVFLSKVEKPTDQLDDLDLLIQSLHKMRGQYTFHAMWWNDPGVSLIVAGPDRPMWYMHNENHKLHVYGSEKESARAIYKQFGIDRKSLREGELKEGSAMLIKEGVILRKWEFELPSTYSASTFGDPTMERVSDYKKLDIKNKDKSHWTRENAPITLDEAKDFDGASLFCLKHPDPDFIKSNFDETRIDKILKSIHSRALSAAWIGWEADEVWASLPTIELYGQFIGWTNAKIRFFTIYQGIVEMVWDSSYKMLDVYNWSLQVDQYPWRQLVLPTAKPLTRLVDQSDKSWFNKRLDKSAPLGEKAVQKRLARMKTLQTLVDNNNVSKKKTNRSFWDDDIEEYYVPHTSVEGMIFLQNKYCVVHSSFFESHPKPLECPYTVESAWDMLHMLNDLNDAKDIFGDAMKLSYKGTSVCHETDEAHAWEESGRAAATVVLKYDNGKPEERFEVTYPVAEACARPLCTLRRNWANVPHFGMTEPPHK